MKTIVLTVLAVGLSTSAMALSPDQVGPYVGTITRSVSDYNTKKPMVEKASAIMIVNANGTAELASSLGSIGGTIGLGTYRGILSDNENNYSISVKGTKLTLKPGVSAPSTPDNGVIVEFDIVLKKAKNLI